MSTPTWMTEEGKNNMETFFETPKKANVRCCLKDSSQASPSCVTAKYEVDAVGTEYTFEEAHKICAGISHKEKLRPMYKTQDGTVHKIAPDVYQLADLNQLMTSYTQGGALGTGDDVDTKYSWVRERAVRACSKDSANGNLSIYCGHSGG
jgi:hypothetical protein